MTAPEFRPVRHPTRPCPRMEDAREAGAGPIAGTSEGAGKFQSRFCSGNAGADASRSRNAAGTTTLAVTSGDGFAGSCRRRSRVWSRKIGCLQGVSQTVRRAFFRVLLLHLALGQKHLAARRQVDIVRGVQIFQDLLRDSLEHRRRNLSALMQTDRANRE